MASYRTIHTALHAWYKKHGRHHLPWRKTADPYAIYISETMLQQTQVFTVLERYYFPFLKHFPTLSHLAEASEQEVLKLWEGLGYYTRARNLHKAARMAAPILPESIEGLMALPGIGRNTAHAIAAFAYHQPVAVMEANLKRVLCRFFALQDEKDVILWQKAEELLDKQHPFDYNQAMMDIGAYICTRTRPLCHECPLYSGCKGKENPSAYPSPKIKKAKPVRERILILWQDKQGKTALYQRTERFLGGLYGLPEYLPGSVDTSALQALGHFRHVYSHFELRADVFLAPITEHTQAMLPPGITVNWYGEAEIKQLPLSKADEKGLGLRERLIRSQ